MPVLKHFEAESRRIGGRIGSSSWLSLLVAIATLLTACGGGVSSPTVPQVPLTLSGNWQFTMAPQADGNPGDPTFNGGLQGGFLVQSKGSVTGTILYSISSSQDPTNPCSAGSAAISGTINGQALTLTAVAGSETFTLVGNLSLDAMSMSGSYTSTGATSCGYALATGSTSQWTATLVPPITGSIQGSFVSTGGGTGLSNQVFPVSGALTQAENVGGATATVSGNLNFLNPATGESDYPCFTLATVQGQISGNTLALQIIGNDGSTLGQVGEPIGSAGNSGVNPVTVVAVHGGYALQDSAGPGYAVSSPGCPAQSSPVVPGDSGNICLALNGAGACKQPITLSPAALIFPPQMLETASMQTITLTNTSAALLNSLTLTFANNSGTPNFTETDDCGLGGIPSLGEPFYLNPQQFCMVTITFTPQETCAVGLPPSQCPSPLASTLTLTLADPVGGGTDLIFTVPISGTGFGGASRADLIFDRIPDLTSGLTSNLISTDISGDRTLPRAEHYAEIN
jgi:hypothetical protein